MVCLLAVSVTYAGAATVNPGKQYPQFQVGASGILATIEPGLLVTVTGTEPGTPAVGKVVKGDVIVAANGQPTAVADPRVPLGEALGDAEGKDGKFTLTVKRGSETKQVVIEIPVLGPYSPTWPLNCAKSKTIIKQTAEKLVKGQQEDGWFKANGRDMGSGLNGCMAALFLMSTGDDAYMPNVQKFTYAMAKQAQAKPTGSSWHLGYQLILMGEYYLRTGDKKVLPAMRVLSTKSLQGQIARSWGHSMTNTSVGYVQSGQMNSAGVTVFLGLCLARECGVTEAETPFIRAMNFFYRMPGHGSICYGDHRAEIYVDTNGRNEAIACAMSLLQGQVYQMEAKHLAMLVADSYFAPEAGHTGGGFNIIWRGITIVLLDADQQNRYRRHMQQMKWYYDLCRLPNGSFKILPSPATRYSGEDWGYQVGLTYTAPLKNLRITGLARTEHSVKAPALPALPWGTPRDKVFLQSDYCQGYGTEDEPPHVIYEKVHGRGAISVEYAARQMRHFSPMIRTWAAYKLADIKNDEAYDAISEALNHTDPRVRRAGCDSISSYKNWGRSGICKLPREVVTAQFVPAIEKMLNDPDAAWWEIDGALSALGCAEAVSIRKNMATIKKFAVHPEWYLRESAYWALVGLNSEITGPELMFLADMYVNSRHVYARSSYDGGIGNLLKANKGSFGDELNAQYVRKIGKSLHSALLASGYDKQAAHHEATHRIMMTLKRFKNPPYKLLIPDFLKYLETWTPGFQHSNWLITGSGWQVGLCKVLTDLGADGKPLADALRKCQAKVANAGPRDRSGTAVREALTKTLAEWDKKYGGK